MSRRNIDWQADILSRRLERASVVLPDIRDHLVEQRRHVRTIGAPSLEPGRQGGTQAKPTERTFMDLDHCDYLLGQLDDALATINVAVDLLDSYCREALGYRKPFIDDDDPFKPRCIGDNTAEGAECWSIPAPRRDETGTKIEDGRCTDCGHRWDTRKRNESNARRLRRHFDQLGTV